MLPIFKKRTYMSNPVEKLPADPYSNAYQVPVVREVKEKKTGTISKIIGAITKVFRSNPNEALDKPEKAKNPKYQKL